MNAVCMAGGAVVAALLPLAGMGPPGIVGVAALGNLGVVAWLHRNRV